MTVAQTLRENHPRIRDVRNVPVNLVNVANGLEKIVGDIHVVGLNDNGHVVGNYVPDELLKFLGDNYVPSEIGKAGETITHRVNGQVYVVVGLGKKEEWTNPVEDGKAPYHLLERLRSAVGSAYNAANHDAPRMFRDKKHVSISLDLIPFDLGANAPHNNHHLLEAAVNGAMRAGDQYSRRLFANTDKKDSKISEINILTANYNNFKPTFETARDVTGAEIIGQLVFEGPSNYITSDSMLKIVNSIASVHNTGQNEPVLRVTSQDFETMRKKVASGEDLAYSGLVAVASAYKRAQFIEVEYRGDASTEDTTLFIGKGIEFDTGGNSIKYPATAMKDMYGDNGGAASAIGLMHALAATKAKVNVKFYIAATANMIDGDSYRQGHILDFGVDSKGEAHPLVKIDNTDAEGRLVMATAAVIAERDAAAIKKRGGKALVISDATLTGASQYLTGLQGSAALFNEYERLPSDFFAGHLKPAGEYMGQKFIPANLDPELTKALAKDQPWDALSNAPTFNQSGAFNGAALVRGFLGKLPYIGLDIASALNKPATGIGKHLDRLQFNTLQIGALYKSLVSFAAAGYGSNTQTQRMR